MDPWKWSEEWVRLRGQASRWARGSWCLRQDLLRRDVLYYKGRVDMDGLEVVDLEDGKDRELHVSIRNAFRLRCSPTGESHLLCAKKPEQKQRWLKAFAREREQVRLDQETGARSHPALLCHHEAPPSLLCLPMQKSQHDLEAVKGNSNPWRAPRVEARDTSWFWPQAWVCWPARGSLPPHTLSWRGRWVPEAFPTLHEQGASPLHSPPDLGPLAITLGRGRVGS